MPRHRFYNSPIWKHLRNKKLLNNPLCESCEVEGRYIPATDVDHIQAINSGGSSTDPENLQSLCHRCHSRKTLFERLGKPLPPVKGCDASGRPLDRNHWWNKKNLSQLSSEDRAGIGEEG